MSRGNWITTSSGHPWFFGTPYPDEVRLPDVAHALAHVCRYGGHCTKFYSVAEHSVHVSLLVPPGFEMEGLMHDATEAYLGDLPRPLKHLLPQYKEMEAKTRLVVAAKFGLADEVPPEVEHVDHAILFVEKEQLLPPMQHAWMDREWGLGAEPDPRLKAELKFWPPAIARAAFLRRYEQIVALEKLRKAA